MLKHCHYYYPRQDCSISTKVKFDSSKGMIVYRLFKGTFFLSSTFPINDSNSRSAHPPLLIFYCRKLHFFDVLMFTYPINLCFELLLYSRYSHIQNSNIQNFCYCTKLIVNYVFFPIISVVKPEAAREKFKTNQRHHCSVARLVIV